MKRKLCYVGTEITPSKDSIFVGGYVNVIVSLSKVLSTLGWEIHVVTTPSRFFQGNNVDFPWGKVHLLNVYGEYGSFRYGVEFFIKAVKRICNIDQKESFDIIHLHSGFLGMAIISFFLKRKLNIPTLLSLYCPVSFFPINIPMEKYFIKELIKSLDKIVAITYNVKTSLINYDVDEDKINVIYPCINMDFLNPFSRYLDGSRKYGNKNSETMMVLFVGNNDKTKGLDVFLCAAELILKIIPSVKFVITLHETNEIIDRVRTLAYEKLGSHVVVMGLINDMPNLMACADVLVVPWRTTKETFDLPLVILEAFAVGTPVVASRIGGIPELIHNKKTGILVEPGRADELADAIISLLTSGSLALKISKQSASLVNAFSSTVISRKLNDLYLEVMQSTDYGL